MICLVGGCVSESAISSVTVMIFFSLPLAVLASVPGFEAAPELEAEDGVGGMAK